MTNKERCVGLNLMSFKGELISVHVYGHMIKRRKLHELNTNNLSAFFTDSSRNLIRQGYSHSYRPDYLQKLQSILK